MYIKNKCKYGQVSSFQGLRVIIMSHNILF